MLNHMQNQLTDLLAFARSVIQSFESMAVSLMHGRQPARALVPVPVKGRPRPVRTVSCDRGYQAYAGSNANAAVRMHADPVTEGWRSLDFGTIKTGETGHSQPSRFAT